MLFNQKTKVQNLMKMLPILLVTLLPLSAMAAPTVTFQGEVTAQTCQLSLNGETDGVVLLPTVSTNELPTAGTAAGLTPFTISVTGCTAASTETHIAVKFLGHDVTATGYLGNKAAANAASNVSVMLSSEDGTNPIHLNGVTSVPGLVLPPNQSSASHRFAAQYVAEGAVTAGAVTAVAEYTLSYL